MRKISNKNCTLLSVVIVAILGIVLSFAISSGKLAHSYSWKDVNICSSLLDYEHEADNVDIDWATGEYTPLTDDPWILFTGINAQNRGILVSLKKEADTPIEIKMYWSRQGEDALSESHTRTVYLDKNEKTAYVKLPAYAVGMVRLDISEECLIDSITMSDQKVMSNVHITQDFIISFILRLIIIWAVLYVAYLAHKERIRNGARPIAGIFVDPSNPNRRYEYDYIRTLAALLVIMMHSVIDSFAPLVSKGDPGYFILKIILAVSLVCNVLYIMLSGALLLKPTDETIGQFYQKRLSKVIIPTLSYYLLYVLLGYPNEVFSDGIGRGIWTIVKGLITSRPEYMLHMWFIYAILSLYILAPFLRIVVSHITTGQLFGLILAGFIFDCFTAVCPMFGLSFGIDTPIASWMGVFLLGYYMTLPKSDKEYYVFMGMGLFGLIVSCAMVYFYPEYLYYESNWAPMMWLEGAGIFAFFIRFKNIFGKRNVIIASISKYNFSIMLVHVLILMKVVLPIGWRLESEVGHLSLCIAGMILVSFVISYVISVFYDNTAIISANYVYKKIFKQS